MHDNILPRGDPAQHATRVVALESLRCERITMLAALLLNGTRAGSDLHGRMYAPGFGIAEDPATGSAAAAMAGYLAKRDPRRDGVLRWRLEQGFEMKRPSILDIEADVVRGAITGVRVGGATVLVCEGTMLIEG